MLRWMVFDQQLIAYSSAGRVQPYTTVMSVIQHLVQRAGEMKGPNMDAAIQAEFAPELAAKLVGKDLHDRVYDEPLEWNEADDLKEVDPGFIIFATEIDWHKGTLWAEWVPSDRERWEPLFPSDEFLGSEFDDAEFEVSFRGISFDYHRIEMLLPTVDVQASSAVKFDRSDRGRAIGRPPKWDWEGALAFVVSKAQHPDGLPVGPGAQARIEEMIAEWFMGQAGEVPAPSQIRQRAAKIFRNLENA
jgi:hypothetical protein